MRIAEVLLKRQSWLLYQQELDQLRGEANGEVFLPSCCAYS